MGKRNCTGSTSFPPVLRAYLVSDMCVCEVHRSCGLASSSSSSSSSFSHISFCWTLFAPTPSDPFLFLLGSTALAPAAPSVLLPLSIIVNPSSLDRHTYTTDALSHLTIPVLNALCPPYVPIDHLFRMNLYPC